MIRTESPKNSKKMKSYGQAALLPFCRESASHAVSYKTTRKEETNGRCYRNDQQKPRRQRPMVARRALCYTIRRDGRRSPLQKLVLMIEKPVEEK